MPCFHVSPVPRRKLAQPGLRPDGSHDVGRFLREWYQNWVVVWNMAVMTFHSVGNVRKSQLTKSMIFQRGRLKPPTSNAFLLKCLIFSPLTTCNLFIRSHFGTSLIDVFSECQCLICLEYSLLTFFRTHAVEKSPAASTPPVEPQIWRDICKKHWHVDD